MRLRASSVLILAFVLVTFAPGVHADGIPGADLRALAILGTEGPAINEAASTVTGKTDGCCKATPVTKFIPTGINGSGGAMQMGDSTAKLVPQVAQGESAAGITAVSALALRAPESFNLDGGNSATTASTSVVDSVNTGSYAGVYWAMREGTATFGSGSSAHTEPRRGLPMQATSLTLADTDAAGVARSGILDTSNAVSRDGAINGGIKGGVIGSQTLSPVPEPATLLLLGTGFAGLFTARRRRGGRRLF